MSKEADVSDAAALLLIIWPSLCGTHTAVSVLLWLASTRGAATGACSDLLEERPGIVFDGRGISPSAVMDTLPLVRVRWSSFYRALRDISGAANLISGKSLGLGCDLRRLRSSWFRWARGSWAAGMGDGALHPSAFGLDPATDTGALPE